MADELINLVEFAKGHSDPVASGMIEQFAASSDVLAAMSFKPAAQGLNRFDRETSEPAVGFRAINSEPEISYGTEETFQDACFPISGLIEFDRIKLKRYGEAKRTTYMMGQMKKANRVWTDTFIKGNNSSDPKEFDGMQTRCVADAAGNVDGSTDDSRLVANATGSGGGALSMSKMDLVESLVNQPTHWMASRRQLVRFKAAARDPNLTNNRFTDDYDSQLGRRVTRFGDVPILTGYEVSKDSTFLPYNEVAHGGGSAVTTSLYLVSIREDGLCGIHTGEPEYIPVDTDRGVFKRDLFEWDSGITQEDFYASMRLSSITDAPIVA
ncbi:MAG: major capsid protein [Pikeienuella sp.]